MIHPAFERLLEEANGRTPWDLVQALDAEAARFEFKGAAWHMAGAFYNALRKDLYERGILLAATPSSPEILLGRHIRVRLRSKIPFMVAVVNERRHVSE